MGNLSDQWQVGPMGGWTSKRSDQREVGPMPCSRFFSIFRNSFCFDGCCFLHLQAVKKRANVFSDGADDLNTCCRNTMQSRKKGAKRYWGELSGLIGSPHSVACCLRNGEEPPDASANAPAAAGNWEFIM